MPHWFWSRGENDENYLIGNFRGRHFEGPRIKSNFIAPEIENKIGLLVFSASHLAGNQLASHSLA